MPFHKLRRAIVNAEWMSRRVDRNMLGSTETTGCARGRYAAVGWNTGMAVYQKRHSGEYPSTSGVYVLGTGWTWVYIGESNDMLRRLLELFESPTPCIAKHVGLVFGYELVPTEGQRLARHDQLIRELVPACNQPLG